MIFKPFPVIMQHDTMDCGPAALTAISEYYGRKYSLSEITEICNVSKLGTTLHDIVRTAKILGFETKCIRTNVNKLYEYRPLPCILHWEGNHFVTLYSIKKSLLSNNKRFYISDPAFGRIRLSEEHFSSFWAQGEHKGVAIVLYPSPTFYEKKPQIQNIQYRKDIASLIHRFRKEYIVLLSCISLNGLFAMIVPFTSQLMIDVGLGCNNINFVAAFLLAQIFLFLGCSIINVVKNWTLLYCNSIISIDILSCFLKKAIKLPFAFFDVRQVGDFTARMDDHERIQEFLTSNSMTFAFSIFSFIVYVILFAFYDSRILVVYSVVTLLSIIWSDYYIKKEKNIDYRRFNIQRDSLQNIYEIINGISDIKLTGCEDYKISQWQATQSKLLGLNMQNLKLSQVETIGFETINKFKDIFIVFIAAYNVVRSNMSLGSLLAVSYMIGVLNIPLSHIVTFIRSFQYSKVSYSRLEEIQLYESEDERSPIELSYKEVTSCKNIVISDLCFKYPGSNSEFVLNHLYLKIPIGKTTAVVGESGSGKTTLIKVLLKLYSDYVGSVYYSDKELRLISANSIRRCFGVVMQDGYIFSDTIENNITIGNGKEINYDMLNNAIKIASLDDFISSLPQGIKTAVGTGGFGLSGGQRQRLLIARAIYKNPQLFIFDESTPSLDANTEKNVYERLNKYLKGKTVIIIAHRLSTIKNADQIIVLKKGSVVENGCHKDLLMLKGEYYTLVKNQLDIGRLYG